MFAMRRCVTTSNSKQMKRHLSVISSGRVHNVPHFDFELCDGERDLEKTLIQYVKPEWKVDSHKLQRREVKNGMMSKVIIYAWIKEQEFNNTTTEHNIRESDRLLIKVHGNEDDVTKQRAFREFMNIQELARHNIAAPILCTFENGCCFEPFKGNVCSIKDFQREDMLRKSAYLIAEIHNVALTRRYLELYTKEPVIFQTLSDFLNGIPIGTRDIKCDHNGCEMKLSLEDLREEASFITEKIKKLDNLTLSYCHNDLHALNILQDESHGVTRGSLRSIDHEFGGVNFSAFDIANHFGEFCGIENFDYTLYPSKARQFWWLRVYLENLRELKRDASIVTKGEVEELYKAVQIMSLLTNLLWTCWAFVPDHHLDYDFDYVKYGKTRLNEYFRRKNEIL